MSIDNCKIITLPKISDNRGDLTFIEGNTHIPFSIKRVFYMYGIAPGEHRGNHAHKKLHEFLICLSGTLDVEVDDGQSKTAFHLDSPSTGLHLPPMIWAIEKNFSPGSVCLVLASDVYDESDYIRDYAEFLNRVQMT